MIGLEGAGKSTLLYRLQFGKTVPSFHTCAFEVITGEYKNISFTLFPVDNPHTRPLWQWYIKDKHGMIFVVDSADRERIEEAREGLMYLICEDDLHGLPLLVFANKQDLPNPMSIDELTEKLSLETLRNRKWHIQAASAISGDGLNEGIDWLLTQI
ncbi:ADP-ribosylation factor family domain-containing protein [Ditylenchus destructor]|nr:ADP-ribosylation factor family domain-containing protein [Ditylenchus destructor]